jgi:DNA-binding NtrC family response regulator
MAMRNGSRTHARILMVDDDQATSQMLGKILQNNGYEVDTAFCGREAIAKAERFIPDLLVSDICKSSRTGIRYATQILSRLPGCKVLFLSSQATMSEISDAVPENLVYSIAPKPLHPLDFLNVVAYMLPEAASFDNPPVVAPQKPLIQQRCVGRPQ